MNFESRNNEMLRLRKKNMTFGEIGGRMGVSRERVRQICLREERREKERLLNIEKQRFTVLDARSRHVLWNNTQIHKSVGDCSDYELIVAADEQGLLSYEALLLLPNMGKKTIGIVASAAELLLGKKLRMPLTASEMNLKRLRYRKAELEVELQFINEAIKDRADETDPID